MPSRSSSASSDTHAGPCANRASRRSRAESPSAANRSNALVNRQNVAIALGFEVLFLALAAQNMATLWLAVAADMGATLVVIFNGLRLLGGP